MSEKKLKCKYCDYEGNRRGLGVHMGRMHQDKPKLQLDKPELSSDRIEREQEFNDYVRWKSIPGIIKGESEKTLNKLGIDNPQVRKFASIENQKEFASEYGINESTLAHWNKVIKKEDLIRDHIPDWTKELTPNVFMALYRTIIQKGRAYEVEAWMNFVEDRGKKVDVGGETLKEFFKATILNGDNEE